MNVNHTANLPTITRKNVYSPVDPDETEEQRLKRHWKAADEAKFGKMPDPSTEQGRIDWLTVIGKQYHGFFLKCGMVNNQARKDFVKEVKDILVARNRYDVDFAFDLARICLDIRRDGMKNKTVLDTLKEHEEMVKKQAPAHVATDEQKAKAQTAFGAKTKTDSEIAAEIANDTTELFRRWKLIRVNLDAEKFGAESKIKWQKETLAQFGADTVDELVAGMVFDMEKATVAYKNIVQDALKALNNIPQVTQEQLDAEIAAIPARDEPLPGKELDKVFPRCDTCGEPLDDDGKCPNVMCPGKFAKIEHWSRDDKKRGKFLADVNSWFNKYQVPLDDKARQSFVRASLGVDHLAKTPLSQEDATAKVKLSIDDDFAPTSTPAKTNVQNAPISNQEASNLNETQSTGVKTSEVVEMPPKAAIPIEEKHYHTEAPYSCNFRMIDPHGVEAQHTVRANSVREGIAEYEWLLNYMLSHGYTIANANGRTYSSAPTASAPVPSNGNGASGDSGIVPCMMIEVGTTFMGGKPALKFSCDGFENPLQYAKQTGEMVKLLGKVKQSNNAPFTAEDLVVGKKYGGAWRVAWKDAMGSDGKMHHNVESVMPA